jgi:hypothetical protein
MKSDPLSVAKIEETLDAICRTLTKHRAELRLQVKLLVLEENTDRSRRKLADIRLNRKIWRHDQMESFYATTLKICSELGAWATDYYVSQVIAKVIKSAVESGPSVGIWDLAAAE